MTPEGRIKHLTKQSIVGSGAYYHMPVQNGMGSPTLDLNGCQRGYYFAVECKAPGAKPTKRQLVTMRAMVHAGASVFLIDGDSRTSEDASLFVEWLKNPGPGVVGPQVQQALYGEDNDLSDGGS